MSVVMTGCRNRKMAPTQNLTPACILFGFFDEVQLSCLKQHNSSINDSDVLRVVSRFFFLQNDDARVFSFDLV